MLKASANVLFGTNTDCCSSFQAIAGLIMFTRICQSGVREGAKFNACCLRFHCEDCKKANICPAAAHAHCKYILVLTVCDSWPCLATR